MKLLAAEPLYWKRLANLVLAWSQACPKQAWRLLVVQVDSGVPPEM